MESSSHHDTVLLEEAVDSLVSKADGFYVDATFGRGGHSREILRRLDTGGKLMGIDKDPIAVSLGQELQDKDERFQMVHGSFANLPSYLSANVGRVDGVLADLGVSSPQLDNVDRGFSFMGDGPLDMRMDTSSGASAAEWLAVASQDEVAKVLREYGEEKFSKRIAAAIVTERDKRPIKTTAELAKVVAEANPAWEKHKHPATRAFQAIRIHINNELEDLENLLQRASGLLAVGGRLVIISFHSLEDRIVKRFMRDLAKGDEPPPGVPVMTQDIDKEFHFTSRPIKPSTEEIGRNVRSRSAIMRVLERIADA